MKAGTKKLLNFLLIFGTLAIVLLIALNSGEDLTGAVDALRTIGPAWILLCVLSYCCFTLFDALSMWYFLRRQGYHVTLRYMIYVAISGAYYSNVTPGATGGQPMQVYSMNKAGVPVGIGTSTVLVKFICFQFMLAVFSTVLWITHGSFVAEQLDGNRWILIVGYVYNTVMVTALALLVINRSLVWALLRLIIRLGTRLRLIKNPEMTSEKWESAVDLFHASVMMLKDKPLDLLVQLLISSLQLTSYMSVIFFLYHAFGLQGATFLQLVTLAVLQYVSAAYTPLPGASGAQEGVFFLYFSKILPDGVRLMCLLLWRFFTYYLSLLVGAVVTVYRGFKPSRFHLHHTDGLAALRQHKKARENPPAAEQHPEG